MAKDICAGAFIIQDDKFLFGKRSKKKKWAAKKWDIVGGHALKHEDPLQTCKRETLEEIGITVLNPEFITVTDVWDKSKQEDFTYYIYWVTEWEGEVRNCSEEHTKLRWFTRAELNDVSLALSSYLKMIDEKLFQ